METEHRLIDRLQIVGLIFSTLVSIVLILLANQNPVESIILGSVISIIFQLFDQQIRHRDTEARLLKANALSQTLFEDQWLIGHIQKIVESYRSIKQGWFWWYKERAGDALVQCRNVLQSLDEGYMIANPRSAWNFGNEVSQKAERSIKGVDLGPNSFPWWRGSGGQEFIRSNAEAARRQVRVTRVFIQPMKVLHEAKDVLNKQASEGIEVFVAQPEELPSELYQDYTIVDDRVVSVMEFDGRGEPREEKISIDPAYVQRMVKNFDLLVRRAKKLADVFPDLDTEAGKVPETDAQS